ncbi:MAG: hypothetical protein QHH19_04905 [Candidatus Thermoplasmatota archaeon]|jgi:uncharacterized membrane protein|nr:hypothetical protein [Candidatus Thermoplasmatota archaeon]
MKINNEKLVGYILLIVGLCIMIYTIATVISVFTGGGGIPVKILEEKTTQGASGSSPEDTMMLLFPMFNALIWVAIAFLLVAAGGRVARIGIQMMKASLPDIKIIKEKEITDEVAKQSKKEGVEETK